MTGVLTSIFLDTRYRLKDGTYPVKLRLTHQRSRKYFTTPYSFSVSDFNKVLSQKPGKLLKDAKLELQAIEQQANEVIKKIPHFTFSEFEKRFLSNPVKNEVFSAYDEAIDRLNREGRASTANSYESARASLWRFSHGKAFTAREGVSITEIAAQKEAMKSYTPLPFTSITSQFLKDYEHWMKEGGRTITTVGMYLRTLKALFNNAIASGDVNGELYPFSRRKYQIPSGVNTKKALTLADIKKIFTYEPATESEARNRDLWIFSYLCNGINIKDIAKLKYKQLDKHSISFIRSKTERSTRQQLKTITAAMTPEVHEIIQKWGNKPVSPESYVFPILSAGLSPQQEMAKVRQAIKTINAYMKRIAASLGIEGNITTYSARHSFSTVLKRSGISIAFISESLGHASEKTTQHYLDSFEDHTRREVVSRLTDFPE